MASIDIEFSRAFLKDTIALVKSIAPSTEVKKAWVYHFQKDQWEFHFGDFYNGTINASNAYEARANGWHSYLRARYPSKYQEAEN